MRVHALMDYERKYLEEWDVEKELDAWAGHLDHNPIPWETTTQWNAPRSTGCFHPSAIARYFTEQPCELYLWHQLMGSVDHHTLGPHGRKRADMGTVIHILMDYYMGTRAQYYGYAYEAEKRICDPELHIEGHIDCEATWPLKRPLIWDYKSIALNAFRNLKGPQKNYLWQVNTYMGVTGAPACVLLYVVKDSTTFFSHVIPFDSEKWDRTEDVLRKVIAMGLDNPPPIKEGSYCKRCGFAYDCFSGE